MSVFIFYFFYFFLFFIFYFLFFIFLPSMAKEGGHMVKLVSS